MKHCKYLLLLSLYFFVNIFISCADKISEPELDVHASVSSCEGCHTDYAHLKAVYSPDTEVPAAGCGGEAPHFEPYDRVYMGGEDYAEFASSTHGKLSCTACHNGVDDTEDKNEAHSADFIKHPSDEPDTYCRCHGEEVDRAHNSLHQQGWGQKKRVALRFGVESYDMIPEDAKHGYEKNCAQCHAGCGDCHVNRPQSGGGGLYKNHKFNRTPNMRDNCVACHVSRGGHAFFGVAIGTQADVHLTKENFDCMSCHSANEIHGDGNIYEQRYTMALLPKCYDCHPSVDVSNAYHRQHSTDLNCNTCHSQAYNNCGSCHVGGEGARIHSYVEFKIGVNPLTAIKPDYKFVTVRMSPHAPDSWSEYGTADLANFNAEPTFKYTTPHNLLRWTERTEVDVNQACYDNCHVIQDGDSLRNKDIYLFSSDLENLDNWVLEANRGVIVDGQLPASWGTN
jgi:hypothetical protein